MQKLSNLASQQWSTPPRIILIKFHQNQPKVAPVLEKSTLLADFALAPFIKNTNVTREETEYRFEIILYPHRIFQMVEFPA